MTDRTKTAEPPIPKQFRGYHPAKADQVNAVFKANFIYLAPSDVTPVPTAPIIEAALHLQRFYRWQMGNGKTFGLNDGVVAVQRTSHPKDWYSTHDTGSDQRWWYWNNALQELWDCFGGGFYQLYDNWIVYLDAEPAPGQGAGGTSGGYTSGVCVLGARDLQALIGQDPEWSVCREIGGLGHEGGHSFGLPHPPPPPNPDWSRAIMGTGYTVYSDCILTEADKVWLNANPHFSVRPPRTTGPLRICPFNDNPRPTPVPRPHPHPTPRK